MEKKLKGLKTATNQEEPFAPPLTKETSANYDNRSQIGEWRSRPQPREYGRSERRPRYFRTAVKRRQTHGLKLKTRVKRGQIHGSSHFSERNLSPQATSLEPERREEDEAGFLMAEEMEAKSL